jgi:YidC/Oxa1 family membrane protein insertase
VDRRYLAFFAASFAIILMWQSFFGRPAPVKPKGDEAAQGEAAEGEKDAAVAAQGEGQDAKEGDAEKPEGEQPAAPPIVAPVVNSPPYLTLGSIDPAGPYRFAAVFDSHGATIQRVELSSPRYRDLHDLTGYLGEMELLEQADGLEVQVVTPGSPAAVAGIARGDVITAVTLPRGEATKPATVIEFNELLARTDPGDSITVELLRSGQAQSMTAVLIRKPLNLIRPEEENIFLHSKQLPQGFEQHPSMELQLRKVGPNEVAADVLTKANEQLAKGVWGVDDSQADKLTFNMVLPDVGLEVIKRFTIARVLPDELDNRDAAAYHVDVDVEVKNLLATPQQVSYTLQGPNGLPIEGFWFSQKVGRSWSSYGIRDVVVRAYGYSEQDFACRNIATGDVSAFGDGQSLAYMGVDAQYFAAAVIPQVESEDAKWYSRFEPNLASTLFDENNSHRLRYQNASFKLTSNMLNLAATGEEGDAKSHLNRMFAGPKHPALLAEYASPVNAGYTLSGFVYYGWFGQLYIPQAMVAILSFFYGIVRNYGIAIILLTVLVRSCMFPLSRKQAKNMAMMQELKPEMDRISARYKDDPQARVKAQQELWAKHNYNPMGGCLLMFIQLPIFIGLYRALSVDVDLREAALIPGLHWCSNLAAPDMFLSWRNWFWPQWFLNGEGMFALGPYLNILPLVTVVLFLVQQKMFMPPPADEQQEMMQRMMKYMMIFMSFLFFKVAAGLCLYFIASSLWGMAERKLIPKPNIAVSGITPTPSSDAPTRRKSTPKQLPKTTKGAKRKR